MQPAVTGTKVHFSLPFGYSAKVVPEQVPPIFFGECIIVYGILRTDMLGKVVSGSKGTVTLEGDLFGAKIKHVLEFEVPEEDMGQSQLVPTIHHLAGKALIKDLQNEESVTAKDEIVKLSCDCSVISKHTAFIAIDEDQKEPVKGSLQTWDVVAPPPPMEMNRMIPSFGGALFHKPIELGITRISDSEEDNLMILDRSSDVDEKEPVKGSLHAWDVVAPFPQLFKAKYTGAVKRSGPPVREIWRGVRSRSRSRSPVMDSLGIVNRERFETEGMLPSAPPQLGGGPLLSSSASGWNVMTTSGSCTPPAPSATRIPPAANPKYSSSSQPALLCIISLQLASGAWKLSAELAALLGHSMEELKTACPAACEGEMELVWATVLVLGYLEKKLLELKDEWELIAMKANNWLKKQHIPEGHSKESFLEKAKTVV